MKIDTIVTDMDDTLLDANGKISDYTLRVVKECVARGLCFIPASGRTQSSLRPFVEQMGTGCPYIGGDYRGRPSAAGAANPGGGNRPSNLRFFAGTRFLCPCVSRRRFLLR